METMTAYILAAALGIVIAVTMYLYSELQLARTINESKTRTIIDMSKTAEELYNKCMAKEEYIKSYKKQRNEYKAMFEQTVEGLEVARHQRDKAQYELSKLKANKASKTITLNVNAEELSEKLIEKIKEKYGKEIR